MPPKRTVSDMTASPGVGDELDFSKKILNLIDSIGYLKSK